MAVGFCDNAQLQGVKDRKPGDYIPSMSEEVETVDEITVAEETERKLLAGLRANMPK